MLVDILVPGSGFDHPFGFAAAAGEKDGIDTSGFLLLVLGNDGKSAIFLTGATTERLLLLLLPFLLLLETKVSFCGCEAVLDDA